MTQADFIEHVQRQVSELAVGASALRNQGGSGLIKAAREHFKGTDLDCFGSVLNSAAFAKLLDSHTEALQKKFPSGAQHWGAARKAMNLFIRDACYNRFLCSEYGLGRIERWLEVPLDKDVATRLLNDLSKGAYVMPNGFTKPNWSKIKDLKKGDSDLFQSMAQVHADGLAIARVHVDLLYWRK